MLTRRQLLRVGLFQVTCHLDDASGWQRKKFLQLNDVIVATGNLETDLLSGRYRPKVFWPVSGAEFEVAVILWKPAVGFRVSASFATLMKITLEFR